MASDARGRARGRPLRWLLATVALLLATALGAALALLVARPATTGTAPAPASSPAPTAHPAGTAPAADSGQQDARYRAYVASVVDGSTTMVSDLIALETCRSGREQCVARLDAAADDAGTMQDRLETTPAPDCLSAAGQRLQDALTFQQRGLRTASTGVETENRVRLVQGLLLTGAGLWRAGQAIVAGRQSSC